MPRPTEDATWATDGGTRVEPSSGEKAAGFGPGNRSPARKANWIVGLVAEWAAWLGELFDEDGEHIYPTPIVRTRQISPFECVLMRSQDNDELPWYAQQVGVSPSQGHQITSRQIFARAFLDLGAHLPDGATVTRVRVLVSPGAARSAMSSDPGDNGRMFIALHRNNANFASPANTYIGPMDAAEQAGSTSLQVISTGTISRLIDKSLGSLWLVVTAGDDADTNEDDVHGIEIQYTDPGLRNF